jgi:hypothetical protein
MVTASPFFMAKTSGNAGHKAKQKRFLHRRCPMLVPIYLMDGLARIGLRNISKTFLLKGLF